MCEQLCSTKLTLKEHYIRKSLQPFNNPIINPVIIIYHCIKVAKKNKCLFGCLNLFYGEQQKMKKKKVKYLFYFMSSEFCYSFSLALALTMIDKEMARRKSVKRECIVTIKTKLKKSKKEREKIQIESQVDFGRDKEVPPVKKEELKKIN